MRVVIDHDFVSEDFWQVLCSVKRVGSSVQCFSNEDEPDAGQPSDGQIYDDPDEFIPDESQIGLSAGADVEYTLAILVNADIAGSATVTLIVTLSSGAEQSLDLTATVSAFGSEQVTDNLSIPCEWV